MFATPGTLSDGPTEQSPYRGSVSAKTRSACAAVLGDDGPFAADLRRSADALTAAWIDSGVLTPRQAYAIALALPVWADGEFHEWLRDHASAPLHDVGPFARSHRRLMFHVGGTRAFAQAPVSTQQQTLVDLLRHRRNPSTGLTPGRTGKQGLATNASQFTSAIGRRSPTSRPRPLF